jgi:hypothetical protein
MLVNLLTTLDKVALEFSKEPVAMSKVGRKTVFIGFWLLGYAIGFFAYLVAPGAFKWFADTFTIGPEVAGVMVSGLVGSIFMLGAVALYSRTGQHS